MQKLFKFIHKFTDKFQITLKLFKSFNSQILIN